MSFQELEKLAKEQASSVEPFIAVVRGHKCHQCRYPEYAGKLFDDALSSYTRIKQRLHCLTGRRMGVAGWSKVLEEDLTAEAIAVRMVSDKLRARIDEMRPCQACHKLFNPFNRMKLRGPYTLPPPVKETFDEIFRDFAEC